MVNEVSAPAQITLLSDMVQTRDALCFLACAASVYPVNTYAIIDLRVLRDLFFNGLDKGDECE